MGEPKACHICGEPAVQYLLWPSGTIPNDEHLKGERHKAACKALDVWMDTRVQ